MTRIITFTALIIVFCSSCTKPETSKPNIILIMADDMGFSDIGCYGGEINTPNLDRLAQDGLRYKQFYNTARCCPTRASLLTGLAPHQTGMGWMTFRNLGHPGYTGELNNNCLTIPEVLKPAGYSTYMSGKWHLTFDENTGVNGPKESWPLNRGFDRFFGTLLGSGSFYNPSTLVDGLEHINPKAGFFYTDAIVDHALGFLKEHNATKNELPFFMYVSFTAPHWPLHARDSTIAKYIGIYDQGWDHIRTQRLARMNEMGIVEQEWKLTSRDTAAQPWEELSKESKTNMVKRMAVYAA